MKLALQATCLFIYLTLSRSSYSSFSNNLLSLFKLDKVPDHRKDKIHLEKDTPKIIIQTQNEHVNGPKGPPKFTLRGIEDDVRIETQPADKLKIFRTDALMDDMTKDLPQIIKQVKDGHQVKGPPEFSLRGIEDDVRIESNTADKLKVFRADALLDDMAEPYQKMSVNRFHLDPVLNLLRKSFRRKQTKESISSSSSSREMRGWKSDFEHLWIHKKFEALNSSVPSGDQVNMVAARPWGVSCGDPNQHDMPWGSCMLSMECEPEFRVYRGDYFCGRTEFVCCAIIQNSYAMYQGFDLSFNTDSMTTDSDEIRDKQKTSKEARKKKKDKEKRKREKRRNERKKNMRKNIRKIIKEIKKLLHDTYRNGTKERKKRTNLLKKFIKDLKRQYRKDRDSVYKLRDKDMLDIDERLHNKLHEMMKMNQNFVANHTFRELVVNGTLPRSAMRMLLEKNPQLASFLRTRRGRRNPRRHSSHKHQYDIDYGFLYY